MGIINFLRNVAARVYGISRSTFDMGTARQLRELGDEISTEIDKGPPPAVATEKRH